MKTVEIKTIMLIHGKIQRGRVRSEDLRYRCGIQNVVKYTGRKKVLEQTRRMNGGEQVSKEGKGIKKITSLTIGQQEIKINKLKVCNLPSPSSVTPNTNLNRHRAFFISLSNTSA